jgi:anti-sigma B factor antagonist
LTAVEQPPPRGAASVACQVVGRRAVLDVAGEIDLATAPALGASIDEALSNGAAELWIDLTATEFMDSSGLHALIAAQHRAGELNRRFAVICPRGPVRRLFKIAGMLDRLPLFDDRAGAHTAG